MSELNQENQENLQTPMQMPPQLISPPRGKTLIQVVGILLIIFGALGLLIGLISFLGSMGTGGAGIVILLFFEVIMAGCTLGFGIFGVKNCRNAAKAQTIVLMGIILCVLRVIDLVLGALVVDVLANISVFTGAVFGLILPILYIIGGSMNKKSQQAPLM